MEMKVFHFIYGMPQMLSYQIKVRSTSLTLESLRILDMLEKMKREF